MTKLLCLLAALLCVHLFSFGQITVSPAAICPGKTVTLSIAPITGSSYHWQRANTSAGPFNNIGGAASPSYATNNAGWYRILTGPVLEDTSAAIQVTTSPNPVASFTFNTAVLCAGTPLAFTNTSGTGTCVWDFGDPASDTLNFSTDENPVHTFVGTAGTGSETFTVKLVFTNAGGCKDSITHDVTLKQSPSMLLGGPGAVVFEGHNYFKLCGTSTTFTFINLSTTTATNTNYQIIWGDGSPDFNSPVFNSPLPHIYTTGTHLLQFIISGPNGCTDTADYYVFLGTNPAVGLNNPGNTTICSATPLTFPISGTSTNSPGTMYTVTFNDGTPPITFPHPPLASISHIFLQSSCGTSSGGYANSYSATIQASNPCFTSSATVVPIFVSGKTETRFDILPQDTICVNTVATFNNATLSNVDNQNGICKINQAIWQITPPTGWTVTAGNLGNDFGSNDVSLWVLGSTSLSVRFTVAGTYSIKLKTGNAVCGNDSLIKTICVNPLPLASFTADNIAGCAPVNVNTTNNSNSPLCGYNTYLWSVSFAPAGACVQTTPTYTYTNGTSATSINPQFQFNSPGVYTITLVTRSSAGLCISVPFSRTITVKGKPVVTMATVPPACANANVNPAATSVCFIDAATTYAWSFPGGTPSASSSASPGTVTYATPGAYTISLSVTNECGTTTASQSVTIKPVPDFTVPADVVVCPGAPVGAFSFTSTPAGASFSWTNNNTAIGLAASGNGTIPVFTAANATANPITATITVTATLNGCSRQHTFTVTVNPRPAAPAVVTPVNYCKDETASPLSATAGTGNTLHWYNVATGGIELPGAPTPSTATAGTFNYWVSQTNSPAGCEGPRAMITVTIKPVPVINTTFSNPTSCGSNSGSITITGLVTGTTYTYSYVNAVGTLVSQTAVAVAPGVINITNLPPGTYTNIFLTQNGCVSNVVSTVILTTPTTPAAPVASSNSPVCAGTTLTLSASNVTNGSYHWTGPNGFNVLTQNPSIPAATIAATGTYTVTVSVAGCISLPATTDVVVNPAPSTPVVTSNTPVCAGTTLTLGASSSVGASYLWTGPNGFTSTDQNPVINNATTAATGTYSVTASIGTCTKTSTISVVVNAIPSITASFSNPATCSGTNGSITISGLNNNTAYTVHYTKNTTPVTVSLTSNNSGVIVINSLSSGTYSNIFVTLNNCNSNIAGPFTLQDPSAPAAPVAGSDSPLCTGSTLHLTASVVSGALYNWSGPGGFTATAQNPVLNNVTLAAAGTYTVTATVAGCVSAPAQTTVVVSQTPPVPVVGSNSPLCANANINLTASSITNASYNWTGPNGFTSTNQNPVINNATIAAGGTYTVTVTVGTCSNTNSVNVVVKPTPAIVLAAQSNPTTCGANNGSITISGLQSNTAYTLFYVKNAGAPITGSFTSNAVGNITIPNLSQGTYTSIFVTLNGCSSNLLGPIILTDPALPATPTVSSNAPVCSGTTLTLNAATSATGTATYTWSGPNGFNSIQQNPGIANAPVAASGTYNVTATVNGCTSLPGNVTVVINPTPVVTSVSSGSPICSGSNINLFTASPTAGALTYAWTGPNGFTSTDQNPVITNASSAAGGTYTVTITLGTCTATGTTTVIVKPTPVISTSSSVNPTGCSTATGSILLNGLIANTAYTVSYVKNNGAATTITLTASASGTITISGLTAGTYTNVFVTINNCPSVPVGPFVLTDPNPPAAPNATSNQPVCSGGTLTLSASTSATGTATYLWNGPNGFSSTAASPVINNAAVAASGTYLVTVTINNCTSLAASINVTVNPLPAAPLVTSPVNYCIGVNTAPLTATTSLPANTLLWYTTATGGASSLTPPVPLSTVAGTTDYYVSQKTAAGCEGPRALIRVTINPDAVALFVPTTTIGCPAFNITPAIIGLQPSANNNTYFWYANDVLIGTGIIFPGYIINAANDSVNIKLVTTSVFGCKSDSISKKFYTYKVPQPSFTKDLTQGCGPISVQFTNTTPNQSDFTYSWNFGNGQTSALAQPGTIIFQPAATYNDTFYVVRLTVASVCQTITYKDTVFVSSKPKALFTPNNVNGCSPMRVSFANTSLGIGNSYHWDFDDGQVFNTTSTDPFTHIFYTGIIDTFHVKLIVTNACGSDSISYIIIAAPNNIHLNYSLNGTSQYGCAPHAVAFYNNTSGAGSFQWSFGDGATLTTTDNIDTIYHTYNLPGVYTVQLTALNNCTDTTAERTITVYPKPVAAFSADRYNACVGETINFTDNSTGSASRTWDFGDGTFDNIAAPSHQYTAAGTYFVKLISYNANPSGNVCSDSITKQVVVVSQLPANISISSTSSPCAPFIVTFTNNITPTSAATWDFGDGQFATGDVATHTYTTAGVYTIHFAGTVPGGCHYVKDETITVGGPAGSLAYTAGYVCGLAPVTLQATATNATGYQWNFGDGITQTTTTAQVSHIYTIPGTYIPSVTLQGAAGCTSLLTGLSPIKVDQVRGGFKTTQSQGCGSTEVNFTDTSFAFFGKALVKWKFGDGQDGTGFTINHTYLAAGNYNTEMIVIGNSGCTDTVRKTITVALKNRPAAVIQGPTEKCALENASFNANITSADAISFREWLLSNGAAGSGNTFTYNFSSAGNYTLRLIAGTVNGCYDTTYHNILIKPVPVIIAGPDITLCRGASTALTVAGGGNYQWGPLQGLSCTSCPSPVAAPLATTPYIVSGTNAQGCSASDTLVVTVIQPMHLLVSPNPRICIGDSALLNASGAASYTWSPAATLNNASISNPYATPTATTTYRVIGYDGHSCFTDTSYVTVNVGQKPTVNLGADLTLASGTQHPLIATITNGPIQQWLWTPATDLSCSTCPQPVATIKKDIIYTVKVTTAFGCEASDAIAIKVFCAESQVFIPNAFTPDGDGVNDIVMVRGKGIVSVKHFRIFNRWGELVFEKSNFPPNDKSFAWDGKVKGKISQPEVFVYTAEAMCDNGSTFIFKGNISLIK
jgi:gliding motility-associated-like protein